MAWEDTEFGKKSVPLKTEAVHGAAERIKFNAAMKE